MVKPIKVNGVTVYCGDCIHFSLSPEDEPCKNCWRAIYHEKDISKVCIEDIAFYPKDKEHFLALESMVKKYKDQFSAMKVDAKVNGVSFDELLKQFAHHRAIEVYVDSKKLKGESTDE